MVLTTSCSFTHDDDDRDRPVVLRDVTWADYQRMLEVSGDRSAPRVTYLEGRLEIRSPSRNRESIKSLLGCLVETYCLERDIESARSARGR